MRKTLFFLVLLAAIVTAPEITLAQGPIEGLAGSGSALLTGVDVVNPARLASSGGTSVRILGFAADASNNSFSLSDYNTYNGVDWTDQQKQEILDKIPAAMSLHTNILLGAPSFSVGSFAFTTRARAGMLGAFPKAIFDIILNGNTPGRNFSFSTAEGSALAIGEARLSHGRTFDFGKWGEYGIGVSLKYLYGGAYAKLEEAHGDLRTDPDQIHGQGNFLARTALGGTGWGIDLGATREVGNDWTASFVLQDLFSSINWTHKTKEADVQIDFANGNLHSLENGDNLADEHHNTRDIPSFKTSIPEVMTIGVARSVGSLSYVADWEQGFKKSNFTDTRPRMAVGAEYKGIPLLSWRAGLSAGGRDGKSVAFGLGLRPGPLRLDFSVSSRGGYLPGGGRGIGTGFSFGFGSKY